MQEIILASSSPRRSELLRLIGVPFRVLRFDAPETITQTQPEKIVEELSFQKASHAARLPEIFSGEEKSRIILGADTIVWAGGRVLGKPKSRDEARQMIIELQGAVHEVYTGVTLLRQDRADAPENQAECSADTFYARTAVHVHSMSGREIEAYLDTGDSMDKAGAYGIQGPFAAYIDGIEGDYFNVVGLPVSMVWQHLKKIQEITG